MNIRSLSICQTYYLPGKLFKGNFASCYFLHMIGCRLTSRMMSGFFAGLLFLSAYEVSAQDEPDSGAEYEVSGLITDEFGNPLAGAAVIVRGQPVSDGVITDLDGRNIQRRNRAQLQSFPVRRQWKDPILSTTITAICFQLISGETALLSSGLPTGGAISHPSLPDGRSQKSRFSKNGSRTGSVL